MAHYKNRKPKSFSGCCRMCAMRDHAGGCRTKRRPSLSELRSATVNDWDREERDQRTSSQSLSSTSSRTVS